MLLKGNTFYLIKQQLLNTYDIENKNFINIFFSKITNGKYSIKHKFNIYNDYNNNSFLSNTTKKLLNDFFYKIQKIFFIFSRLISNYKCKKLIVVINNDLYMNTIEETDKHVFTLIQCGKKYLFNIHNIIKIINNSLSNTIQYILTPLKIKNPYNNTELSYTNLYNIYIFIRYKTIINPSLFFHFVNCNFDTNVMLQKYAVLIVDYAVKTHISNHNNDYLYEDILEMIQFYNKNFVYNKIIIDIGFPRVQLVNIMKPYLKLYLNHKYLVANEQYNLTYINYMNDKLVEFNNYNKSFGRKLYKIKNVLGYNNTNIEYNSVHINFYSNM